MRSCPTVILAAILITPAAAAEPTATQLLDQIVQHAQAVQVSLANNQSDGAGYVKQGIASLIRQSVQLRQTLATGSPEAKDIRAIKQLERSAQRIQAGLGTAVAVETRQHWAAVQENVQILVARYGKGDAEPEAGKDTPTRRMIKATRERLQAFADQLEASLRGDPWLFAPLARARQMELHLGALEVMAAVEKFDDAGEQIEQLRAAYNALGNHLQQRMGATSPAYRELQAIGNQLLAIEQQIKRQPKP